MASTIPWALFSSYVGLLLLATVCITCGSQATLKVRFFRVSLALLIVHASQPRPRIKKAEGLSHEDEDEDEEVYEFSPGLTGF